jgi:hypothetical protein
MLMSEKTITSANGQAGILIRVLDKVMFRVYDGNKGFIDYDLLHSDLAVVINDPDAYFYKSETMAALDHSPATLGSDAW